MRVRVRVREREKIMCGGREKVLTLHSVPCQENAYLWLLAARLLSSTRPVLM